MVLNLPEAFVFMKIGLHGGQKLPQILKEKRQQIRDVGYCFWGYGGNTLHPIRTVVPFVQYLRSKSLDCYLGAEETPSDSVEKDGVSAEYSVDNFHWQPIPKGLRVTGSRYALVLSSIIDYSENIHLANYDVAAGPSAGKNAASYLRWHVDKGCVEKIRENVVPYAQSAQIRYVARLCPPYAVFLPR